jgi:hypothetical protein
MIPPLIVEREGTGGGASEVQLVRNADGWAEGEFIPPDTGVYRIGIQDMIPAEKVQAIVGIEQCR